MVYRCWLVVIGFKKRIKIDNFSYNINNIIYRWFLGLKLMCLLKLNCVYMLKKCNQGKGKKNVIVMVISIDLI